MTDIYAPAEYSSNYFNNLPLLNNAYNELTNSKLHLEGLSKIR